MFNKLKHEVFCGFSKQEYNAICIILKENNIKFKDDIVSRNTLLSGVERLTTDGQRQDNSFRIYHIYVAENEYEKAIYLARQAQEKINR